MKKRRLRIEKMARREAYYRELKKLNLLTAVDENEEDQDEIINLTKRQLIEKLAELGIEANIKMKKNEILDLFSKVNIKGKEQDVVNEDEGVENTKIDDIQDSEEENIEDIEIDEIQELSEEETIGYTVVEETEQEQKEIEDVEEVEV